MKTDFFKCYGATERHDELIKISASSYLLIFGFGEDEDGKYNVRRYYDHKPELAELRADIAAYINAHTDDVIRTRFVWNGKPVYLSTENQNNFKAAYDIAVQTEGATLPVKFKLGEDADGKPVYHTFTKIEPFTDFIYHAFAFITDTLQNGWAEKDGIDYEALVTQC